MKDKKVRNALSLFLLVSMFCVATPAFADVTDVIASKIDFEINKADAFELINEKYGEDIFTMIPEGPQEIGNSVLVSELILTGSRSDIYVQGICRPLLFQALLGNAVVDINKEGGSVSLTDGPIANSVTAQIDLPQAVINGDIGILLSCYGGLEMPLAAWEVPISISDIQMKVTFLLDVSADGQLYIADFLEPTIQFQDDSRISFDFSDISTSAVITELVYDKMMKQIYEKGRCEDEDSVNKCFTKLVNKKVDFKEEMEDTLDAIKRGFDSGVGGMIQSAMLLASAPVRSSGITVRPSLQLESIEIPYGDSEVEFSPLHIKISPSYIKFTLDSSLDVTRPNAACAAGFGGVILTQESKNVDTDAPVRLFFETAATQDLLTSFVKSGVFCDTPVSTLSLALNGSAQIRPVKFPQPYTTTYDSEITENIIESNSEERSITLPDGTEIPLLVVDLKSIHGMELQMPVTVTEATTGFSYTGNLFANLSLQDQGGLTLFVHDVWVEGLGSDAVEREINDQLDARFYVNVTHHYEMEETLDYMFDTLSISMSTSYSACGQCSLPTSFSLPGVQNLREDWGFTQTGFYADWLIQIDEDGEEGISRDVMNQNPIKDHILDPTIVKAELEMLEKLAQLTMAETEQAVANAKDFLQRYKHVYMQDETTGRDEIFSQARRLEIARVFTNPVQAEQYVRQLRQYQNMSVAPAATLEVKTLTTPALQQKTRRQMKF